MLSVLFAVVMMASAWSALRRHPAYSARPGLRALAIILLALGAVVGTVVAAVHFAGDRSPMVLGTTMAVVILFDCFFLIYVIYTATTSKAARLVAAVPTGRKLVHLHRQKVYTWAKRLGLLALALAALGLVIPGKPAFAAYGLAGFTVFVGAVLLPIWYVTSRMMDVSLTALKADPWVHWVYSPEQWSAWSAVQCQRVGATLPTTVQKTQWRNLGWASAAIAAGVYLISPGSVLEKTVYLLFVVGALAALMLLSVRSNRDAPAKLRVQLTRTEPEVYFGPDGVFANGTYSTWLSNDVFLTTASIDQRPPRSLLFRFEKDIPNPYGPMQIVPIEQAVLLPAGKENDLALLQKKLTERCPTATIALT